MPVYFLRAETGQIKIGHSRSPRRRLNQFILWSPVRIQIVAEAKGGGVIEAYLHERFAATRLHQEWFASSPELEAIIEAVKATGRVPGLPAGISEQDGPGRRSSTKVDPGALCSLFKMTLKQLADATGHSRETVYNLRHWAPAAAMHLRLCRLAEERGVVEQLQALLAPKPAAAPARDAA